VVDIESNPPARRSPRNRPNVPEESPSGSTVPLPSIGSTRDPSPNDMPMEEWGTGVPSGAFFGSNPKYSVTEGDEEDGEGEDDDEESEGEDDDEEGEGEDDEAGEDDEEGDEEDDTSDTK
jgi:hypothetical protein